MPSHQKAVQLSLPLNKPLLVNRKPTMQPLKPIQKPFVPPKRKYDHEACVVFMHHKNDDVTNHHYNLIKQHNPKFPIFPIHNGQEGVVGSVDCEDPNYRDESKWACSDSALYNWFRIRPTTAKRYIVVEWDTMVTQSLQAFYGNTWDDNAVGANVILWPQHHRWYWFRKHHSLLPQNMKPHAAGIAPFGIILLSHDALLEVTSVRMPKHVQNEMRLGTVLRYKGFSLTAHSSARKTISWKPNHISVNPHVAGVYHPVKEITY